MAYSREIVIEFIATGKIKANKATVVFDGFEERGDAGNNLRFYKNGASGTASRTPYQRGDNTFTDSTGAAYKLIEGSVVSYDGTNNWFGGAFGDAGEGIYILSKNGWDLYTKDATPLDSVSEIPDMVGYNVGDKITWMGYYSTLDGGGNWGIVREGVHVADGGSIFTISGDFYVEADLKSDDLNIAKFGGVDGSDVTEAIKAAIVYADDNLKSVVGYGVYYTTSEEITVPAGISVNFPNAVFTNGTGVKDFSAFTFNGSGKNSYINYIFAYGGGITLKSNTADIGFKTIFKCNEGIIIFADGASNLDNKVTGMSIGTCDDAIVFRQNEQGLVQQGNEIRINFVNTCKNTLTFDDGGVHTSQSNWDSNLVELQASDPYQLDDITLFNNLSAYPIPNLVYHIKSWVGGWASIDKLIKGSVSACDFKFSMAKTIEMDEVDSVVTSGVALDSCFFSTARLSNIGTGSSRECTGSTDSSLFGSPLQRVANRCQMTLTSNLEVGENTTCYMWHILCQSNYSDRFLITPLTSDVSIAYIPQGATDTGRVRVLIRNLDDSIILSGTSIEFMVTQLY